jgi:redox-sensing transcriptional repressor
MTKRKAPDIVVGRLPMYLRMLNQLIDEARQTTSSQELGERLGISAAQIRKDLSYFGGFGKYGAGYDVAYLRDQLRRILHLEQVWPVALVGAGDLGHALTNYHGFSQRGFEIAAVFDNDSQRIGQMMGGLKVLDVDEMEQFIHKHNIKIAIIAVPVVAAQVVADKLVAAGVIGLLNYAPVPLKVPDYVTVQNIDPVARLQHMAFYVGQKAKSESAAT